MSAAEALDELAVARLEHQLQRQQAELTAAKEQLRVRQQEQRKAEEQRLAKALQDIDDRIENDRTERSRMKLRAVNLRAQLQAEAAAQAEMELSLYELEKQSELERIALQRMRVLELQSKRSTLDSILDNRTVALDAIQDERQQRDAHSLDNLQYLLSKAELLERELNNGSYDVRSKVAYANQIEERLHGQGVTKDSGQDQFRMVDDVLAGLRARRERQLLDSEEATRSLNDKRVELSEKEAEVRRKRRELQLIQSKGMDFMAELELGAAPPLNFILLNQTDEMEEPEGGEELPLLERIRQLKETVESDAKRIRAMQTQAEQRPVRDLNAPYQGEFATFSAKQLETSRWVREMVTQMLLPPIVDRIMNEQLFERERRTNLELFNVEKQRLLNKRADDWMTQSAFLLYQEFMDDAIADIVSSIHTDLSRLNAVAAGVARETALAALESQPDFHVSRSLIDGAYNELVKRRDASSTRLRFVHDHALKTVNVEPQSLLQQSLPASLRAKLATSSQLISSMTASSGESFVAVAQSAADKLKTSTVAAAAKRNDLLAAKREANRFSLKVRARDQTSTAENLAQLALFERTYWSNMRLDPRVLKGKGPELTAVAGSPTGKFVAAGNTKGGLSVWSVVTDKLVRYTEKSPSGAAVYSIDWMADDRNLLVLDEQGVCRVWSCGQFQNRGTGDLDDTELVALTITHTLTAEDFFRTQHGEKPREETTQPLVPNRARFHPCMSLTGYQPAVMLSLINGVMVRYNLADTSRTNKAIVRGHTQANKERVLPHILLQIKNGAIDKKKDYIPQAALVPYVHREFFQSHVEPIIASTYSDDKVMSLDAGGTLNIWKYENESFSGFGWFSPALSYVVDTTESTFVRRPAATETKVMFPLPDVQSTSSEPMPFAQKLQIKRDAERNYFAFVDSLVLESEPISVTKLPDGGVEKIFLPADASTAASPVITAHAFTYAPFDVQPANEQPEDDADAPKVKRHSRHATYVYDRLQRKGEIIEAQFTPSQLDLVMLVFFPAIIDAQTRAPVRGFEARLQLRLIRSLADGNLTVAPFQIDIAVPPILQQPPTGLSLLLSPPLDVPGSDYIYLFDSNGILMVYSIKTGAQVVKSLNVIPDHMRDKQFSRFRHSFVGGRHRLLANVSSDSNSVSLFSIRDINPRTDRELFTATFMHERYFYFREDTSRLARVPSDLLVQPEAYPRFVLSGSAHSFSRSFVGGIAAAAVEQCEATRQKIMKH